MIAKRLPPLREGERLDQPTFHERYEAMPPGTRAELIGGVVYMPSPLGRPHGRTQRHLSGWLYKYECATPGTEGYDDTTTILGDDSEPQPDSSLLILSPKHGQTRDVDNYIGGAPEFIGEVAASSRDIDLGAKKEDYEKAGVKEYVVVAVEEKRVFWFVRRQGKFEELAPGADAIYRSEVFPGLWLDAAALLRRDKTRVNEVLQQGLATPEHAQFVKKLAGS